RLLRWIGRSAHDAEENRAAIKDEPLRGCWLNIALGEHDPPITHARLSQRSQNHPRSEVAAEIDVVDQDHRRARAQFEKYRCRPSAWGVYLCDRGVRLWQIHADSRRSLP